MRGVIRCLVGFQYSRSNTPGWLHISGMWRSFLEQSPQIIPDDLGLRFQLPIPDSFHHQTVTRKKSIPLGIAELF